MATILFLRSSSFSFISSSPFVISSCFSWIESFNSFTLAFNEASSFSASWTWIVKLSSSDWASDLLSCISLSSSFAWLILSCKFFLSLSVTASELNVSDIQNTRVTAILSIANIFLFMSFSPFLIFYVYIKLASIFSLKLYFLMHQFQFLILSKQQLIM